MTEDTTPTLIPETAIMLQEEQARALTNLSTSMGQIAKWVTQGGLVQVMQSVATANMASSLLQGLTQHSGRAGLDARTQGQNALEVTHLVMSVLDQLKEKLAAKSRGDKVDPDMHNAEEDFKKWQEGHGEGKE